MGRTSWLVSGVFNKLSTEKAIFKPPRGGISINEGSLVAKNTILYVTGRRSQTMNSFSFSLFFFEHFRQALMIVKNPSSFLFQCLDTI
jgi:hypothetical protein